MASRAITFYGFLMTLTLPGDSRFNPNSPVGSVPLVFLSDPTFAGTYRSAQKIYMSNPHETTAGMILSQLGVQCHQPCIKRPPGASGTAISFRPAQSDQFLPKIYMSNPHETTAGMILSQLGVQCHQSCTKRPSGASRRVVSSSGCQSGLFLWSSFLTRNLQERTGQLGLNLATIHLSPRFSGAEPTSQALFPAFLDFSRIPGLGIIIPNSEKLGLLRFLCVCGAIRQSMTDSHASLCFYVFVHRIMHVFIVYSASMSGNSLNRSRGDIVVSSKPKEPLGLTPREVAESPSWLPRAMNGLLSPTQVVSRVFTFFASHESVPFYQFL
ncbi:hypothetical protein CRG98_042336 [Punica granatum]|uniref:Uncharacterized protein n=1 Tax=Punica granatum TaxID=22663 RepID=A0A2I0I0A7_PUNGR|nr:hypothetical protein CRG98_042336 [Punica granatum]